MQLEIFAAPEFGQVQLTGLERNLLLQPLESSLAQANSVQVVFQDEILGALSGIGILYGLKSVDIERALDACNRLAHAFVAAGQPVALIQRVGNHNLLVAVH